MPSLNDDESVPDGYVVIYCASFYSKKAGRRIYAYEYGKKAFRFFVKEK